MAITTPKEFFKRVLTKTKQNDSIIEKDIEVANQFNCFLKNDIAEVYIKGINGNDENDGLTAETAVKSVERAIQIVRDYGFSSSHLYFLDGDCDYYLQDYKNVASTSIHFHTRADNVRLHILNTHSARSENYDYTAFYGTHYNFGTSAPTKSDKFNIAHRLQIIFQLYDEWHITDTSTTPPTTKKDKTNNCYFECCSTVFNACDIYVLDETGNPRVNGLVGFVGGGVVQTNQCRFFCGINLNGVCANLRNTSFVLQADMNTVINSKNSKIFYWNDVNDDNTPKWDLIKVDALRVNANGHNINGAVFNLIGNSELSFFRKTTLQIAEAVDNIPNIERIVFSRNSTIICSPNTLTALNYFNKQTKSTNYGQYTICNGHWNLIVPNDDNPNGNIIGG